MLLRENKGIIWLSKIRGKRKGINMNEKQMKLLRIAVMVLAAAAALSLAAFGAYRIWEKPPELSAAALQNLNETANSPAPPTGTPRPKTEAKPSQSPEPTPTMEPLPEGEAIETSRQDGVYTVLLVGNDNGNGNTDTIVLGKIDTVRHQMDFVNIPRGKCYFLCDYIISLLSL